MRKVYYALLIILIIFILLLFILAPKNDAKQMLKDKIVSELEYIENVVFKIIKKYMSEEYIVDGKLEWNIIGEDLEPLRKEINVFINDFNEKGFSENDIIEFEKRLIEVNSKFEEKNENNFLFSLADLFILIPDYEEKYIEKTAETSIRKIKSFNLYAVIIVLQGDLNSANKFIELAENEYVNLIKYNEYLNENSFYVERIYQTLNEFKISFVSEDLNAIIYNYLRTLGI